MSLHERLSHLADSDRCGGLSASRRRPAAIASAKRRILLARSPPTRIQSPARTGAPNAIASAGGPLPLADVWLFQSVPPEILRQLVTAGEPVLEPEHLLRENRSVGALKARV